MRVPELDEKVCQELRLYYYEDIVKLEKITKRDLTAWKSFTSELPTNWTTVEGLASRTSRA
ncbi:MAG TPA: hypothetical protein VGA18_09625 [Rhodothermales bacterium]